MGIQHSQDVLELVAQELLVRDILEVLLVSKHWQILKNYQTIWKYFINNDFRASSFVPDITPFEEYKVRKTAKICTVLLEGQLLHFPSDVILNPTDGSLLVAQMVHASKTWKDESPIFEKVQINQVIVYEGQGVAIGPAGEVGITHPTSNVLKMQFSPGLCSKEWKMPVEGWRTFNVAAGICFDPHGDLIVVEYGGHTISKVSRLDGTSRVIVGKRGKKGFQDGTADEALLMNPARVAFEEDGSFVFSDQGNHAIRRVQEIDGTFHVSTIAGNGSKGFADGPIKEAKFDHPQGICVDKYGNIIVADVWNYRIRKITPSGFVSTICGNGIRGHRDGVVEQARFGSPDGVCLDMNGNLVITDYYNSSLRYLSPYYP
jgi:DNA-binding beta-propeller fold protein YncE